MHKRMAKSGKNAGHDFWGCTAYPNCKGTRPTEHYLGFSLLYNLQLCEKGQPLGGKDL